jgi:ceramide glucosyltransferase
MSYYFLLFLGVIATLVSFYTIRLGLDYEKRALATISRSKAGFSPRTCLIMACKGDEPELAKNITAMLNQDYEDYYSMIVTDDAIDPAYEVARSVITKYPASNATLITADSHTHASGKVSALLTALKKSRDRTEVYAFLDGDAFAPSNWLTELVDPLHNPSIGATTGFRWYFPIHNGFWAHVQAAWNASGTNLLFNDKFNFPWGGAMAVRADTLEKIGIEEVWTKAISDDLSLNSALRKYGYKILFLPQCMVASFSGITLTDFIRWATNQTALVRAYNPLLWDYALAAYTFFNLTFIFGIVCALTSMFVGPNWLIPAFLLMLPAPIGVLRSKARSTLFKQAMPSMRTEFDRTSRKDCIASLIVPWIMSYCILRSSRTNEIEWRGRKYKLATS